MTSINFNAAATTALRTLQQTNSSLETSQNRVSTGLKIGEAKDNAAYWSISTTLKSDNKAFGTVKDALSLGAATVDTAYQGLNKSLEVLNEIKSKLTAATQDGVDKGAIDAEIKQLQQQLRSIATSASFSNENWLSTNSNTGYATEKTVVSSFTREANGAVTIGTIPFDISESVLFDGSNEGLLQKSTSVNSNISTVALDPTKVLDSTGVSFAIKLGTAPGVTGTIKIDEAAARATGNGDASISNNSELVSVLQKQIAANSTLTGKVSVSYQDGKLTFTSVGDDNVIDVGAAADLFGAADAADNKFISASVSTISTDNQTKATIEAYINIVSAAANSVTTAASKLGAISSRIELQTEFVNTLIDTIEKGVSNLIDADLSEESTRLQALQTKQQLGIQALSIANSSTQNILSLFRS